MRSRFLLRNFVLISSYQGFFFVLCVLPEDDQIDRNVTKYY